MEDLILRLFENATLYMKVPDYKVGGMRGGNVWMDERFFFVFIFFFWLLIFIWGGRVKAYHASACSHHH